MARPNRRYGDTCEACVHRGGTIAAPAMAIPDGNGGILAAYRCPTCGHTWTCAWGIVPGRALPPPPVPGLHPDLAALLSEQAAVNRARLILNRKGGAA